MERAHPDASEQPACSSAHGTISCLAPPKELARCPTSATLGERSILIPTAPATPSIASSHSNIPIARLVIRETIREMNMVAIGRVVLTSREHIIGLEPLPSIAPSC